MAVRLDQPFPELGLDSMMAMTVLRETQEMSGSSYSGEYVCSTIRQLRRWRRTWRTCWHLKR